MQSLLRSSLLASSTLMWGCELPAMVGQRDLTADDDEADDLDSSGGDGDLPSLDFPNGECDPPMPQSCDASSDDHLNAVGLDCIGGTPAAGGVNADPEAVALRSGQLGPYEIREGEKLLILSTGTAAYVHLNHDGLAEHGCSEPDFCPSTDHSIGPANLPAPLTVDPVDEMLTCVDDMQLIGTGDCSNSLSSQWPDCNGSDCEVWDYAELRVNLTVPEHTYGLAFDFAFMSVEWPLFAGGGFNDMFVAWLESESWTGNVSFDEFGNPVTVNAAFPDYNDELEGMAMEGHAGTRWLTTAFGLSPGEPLQLVLAVFDLGDGDHDSVVLLDKFRWTCTGTPPTTKPVL